MARGAVVICDRFTDSTRMYQGMEREGGANLRGLVDQLHKMVIPREPDLTMLIDIDPELGLSRAKARAGTEERFEDMGVAMQARMRAGFLALAQEFAPRFRVIDGARSPEAVAQDVRAAFEASA